MKDFLEENYGILQASPKKVFLECAAQKLITDADLKEALAMVDDRNLSVHIYDDEMAENIAQRAMKHFALMGRLAGLRKK